MIQHLWDKILAFNLDAPFSEYGFSLRLANENYWTKDFTELAVLEYKKFMYLAATSDMMVSPSGIIDAVWHQHLIFTQSYQAFCEILGKQIQHVPSTHNKEDFQKFRQAKERTGQLYKENFGVQPSAIWRYDTMYDGLNLVKAKIKIRSFVNGGIMVMMILLVPFYLLLKPLYADLDNLWFMYTLLVVTALTFGGLEVLNRLILKKMVKKFDPDSFVNSLRPLELVYLKTAKLGEVINGSLNEMLEKELVYVNKDNRITAGGSSIQYLNEEEMQVLVHLKETGPAYYSILTAALKRKPVFNNITNSMEALKKYVYKSGKFGHLFYLNFSVIAILLLLAFTRMVTGVVRNKPFFVITLIVVLLIIIGVFFLTRLVKQIATHIIPGLYKAHILPSGTAENSWQWTYFLMGAAALGSSFTSFKRKPNVADSGGGSDLSFSCGSNCGSSCSSCGGCGGD